MHKIVSLISSLLIAVFLTACGGGSSSSTSSVKTTTGTFKDSTVSGLDYNCSSSTTGTTNASGEYTCDEGNTVSFSIAGIILGTTDVNTTAITPVTLFPNDENASINLAQLLQTLDEDGDPSNGITLEPSLVNMLNGQMIDFTSPTFDTDISALLGVTLVSETNAINHLNIILNELNITLLDVPTETTPTTEPEPEPTPVPTPEPTTNPTPDPEPVPVPVPLTPEQQCVAIGGVWIAGGCV